MRNFLTNILKSLKGIQKPPLEKHCHECKKEEIFRDGLCKKCWENRRQRYKNAGERSKNLVQEAKNEERKIKILAIDDAPSVIEAYKMILRIRDIEVMTAPDGETGLQLLNPDFDMVITGYNLGPGKMNGLEVLKKVKEKYPEMPVAIITGYESKKSRANAFTLGAFEYLRKPFLMEEMYDLVERGVKLRHKGAL